MALQRLKLLSNGFLNQQVRGFHLTSAVGQTFRKWYREFIQPKPINLPPYNHFTQVGDPVLRQEAAPVPDELRNSEEVRLIAERMVQVMRKYGCVGIAAPQIGISLRIIAMEFDKHHMKHLSKTVQESRMMTKLPLTVVVNPTMKVVNYQKHKHTEGCMSVRGYNASVERYAEVTLTGFDELAAPVDLQLSGWNARIAQHEMDHLDGKLYIDHMDRSTFSCVCWEAVNTKGGRVEIPFYK